MRGRVRPWAVVLGAALVATAGAAGTLAWRFGETFGERGRGRNELRDPVDVAVTEEGRVVALDRDREAVVWFSRAGRWEKTLGGRRGRGELRLDRPRGLGLGPDGRLWVVDTGNHRLVVVDEEGAEAFVLGSLGSADGRFRHPADVTFDGRGRLYVADAGNERIQVFRPDGGFLASWDRRTGGRRDHLEKPVAVAYTPEGRGGIWVLNEGWRRLERFDLEGDWEETLDLSGWLPDTARIVDLVVDPRFYRMFLSDAGSGRIWVLNRRGERVAEVRAGETLGAFRPAGLFVERDWDLYAADRAGARVVKFQRE